MYASPTNNFLLLFLVLCFHFIGYETYDYEFDLWQLNTDPLSLNSLNSQSTIDNSYDFCADLNSTTYGYNCDDDEECMEDSLNNTEGPVCCTGDESCYDAYHIRSGLITPINISSTSVLDVRCDGGHGCYRAHFVQTANKAFMSGTNAQAAGESLIGYNGIYCSGDSSCFDIDYMSSPHGNIYCAARSACTFSTFYHVGENLFLYGLSPGAFVEVNYIDKSVYCVGYRSCEQSVMKNIRESVYGNGWHALIESHIESVNNSLIAIGNGTMSQSEIINVTNIFCYGNETCMNSMFIGFERLRAFGGINVLKGANIIADKMYGYDTVTIEINGTHDLESGDSNETIKISCGNDVICRINCMSEYACDTVELTCNDTATTISNCWVRCDISDLDNPVHCPFLGDGWIEWKPTDAPTVLPTMLPTILPTVIPTGEPTNIAVEPSNQPSSSPTGQTTRESTIEATEETVGMSSSSTSQVIITSTDIIIQSTNENTNDDASKNDNKSGIASWSDTTLIFFIISITLVVLMIIIIGTGWYLYSKYMNIRLMDVK